VIYSQNRADWKKKREMELASNGVKGQISAASKELADAKTRLAEAQKREKEIKDRIKSKAKEKLLMAARMKNLHNKEEGVKETQQRLDIENERLRHQIAEVETTHKQAQKEADKAKSDAEQSVLVETEAAKERATEDVASFKATTLEAAQQEISQLQEQLRRRAVHENRAESELMQLERNTQAESLEAREALAKTEHDSEIAQKQISWELQQAEIRSHEIVDEARRQAAQMREAARSGGYNEGRLGAETLLQSQNKAMSELEVKSSEMKKLNNEFKEKMDRQIREKEVEMERRAHDEAAQMHADLEKEVFGRLEHDKDQVEAAIRQKQADFAAEKARVEKEESELADLLTVDKHLQSQVDELTWQLKHEKEELTRVQADAPVA